MKRNNFSAQGGSASGRKTFFVFIITIFLTLGLSISFQSLLAAWTAPLANPPTCVSGNPGCDAPLHTGLFPQSKSGPLTINYLNGAATGLVAYGNVGIGTATPGAKLNIYGTSNAADAFLQINNQGDVSVKLGQDVAATGHNEGKLQLLDNGTLKTVIRAFGDSYIQGGNVGIGTTVPGFKLDVAGSSGFTTIDRIGPGSSNPERGAWNPIWSSIAAGRALYADEEFVLGVNNVNVYNNSGGNGVQHFWESGDGSQPNQSGKWIRIYNNGNVTSPGYGGFYLNISARRNATFVQRFRAKLPVGYNFVLAENQQGTNNTSYWLTSTAGTGKWEEYIRVSHCGNTGTFSGGGHVYVSGTGNVFTWYLASANVYEVDAPTGIFSGRVGIGTAAPAAILDLGQLPSSTEGLIIKIGATTPWSPFVIYKADGSIAFKIDENGNMTGGSAGGWSRNSASGYLYTTALTDKVGIGTTGPTSKFDIRSSGVDGKIGFDAIDDGTTWGNVIISQKPSSLTGIGLGVFGKSDGSKISRFVVNTDNMYLGYPLRPGDGGSLAGTQGTGNLLINGNVGIGTTDPSGGGIIASKFTIKNDSSTSLALLGTSNAKILAINPESNSGATFYNGGGGSWVAAMTLLNGNVGIGTADPAGYKLKVVGNEKIHGKLVVDNTGGYDVDTTYNITTPGIYAAKGEFANLCLGSGGGTDCKTSWAQIVSAGGLPAGINGQTLRYNNGWVPNSILFNDGTSVSIGTAGSLSKLSVNGGLHVGGDSDAGDNNILADGTISAATGATGGFRSTTYTAGQNLIWAFGNAPGYGFSYKQGYPDDIRFHFGDYANPQFLIRQDGNVGIGTTNPTSLLHLYKNLSGTNAEIAIQSGNGTTVQDKWAIYQDQGAGDLRFWNTNTPGGGNALTVLKTGYVGIGTAAPTAKLEVAGQVKITGGNPGANKVLTSDAAGLASWQASAASNAPFFIETIYGDGDLPWRSTANTPQTMRYVYGPFSYAMPGCDSGYTKYYRLYAEFVDTISGGQGVYVRIALDGGTNLDFNLGGTWGGSPSYRNFLSGLFQTANTSHASIQSWVNGSAGPYLEIRKLQIWAYCL